MNVVLRLTEAAVEFLWWVVGWGGLQSHFRVQPNHCVEVVLRCVVVRVVTISPEVNECHQIKSYNYSCISSTTYPTCSLETDRFYPYQYNELHVVVLNSAQRVILENIIAPQASVSIMHS